MKQVATVLLFDADNKLLIYLRDDKPSISYPNHWDLFGGFLEEGESPSQALERELREELDIKLERYVPFGVYQSAEGDAIPNVKHVFVRKISVRPGDLTLYEGQRVRSIYSSERHSLKFASIHSRILNDFAAQDAELLWHVARDSKETGA